MDLRSDEARGVERARAQHIGGTTVTESEIGQELHLKGLHECWNLEVVSRSTAEVHPASRRESRRHEVVSLKWRWGEFPPQGGPRPFLGAYGRAYEPTRHFRDIPTPWELPSTCKPLPNVP